MGVLDGVKVVEVAEHGFVPSGAAILAEWGADVVKVERPTGDPLRGIQAMGLVADTGDFNFLFEQFNRNKRGVAIDLRDADGRAVLDRLLAGADVFITNFLPSARAKLRLDPSDVWAVNPRCIVAIGSGQGLRGPDAELGGFDAVSFWARGGIGHMLTPQGGPLTMPRGAMGDAPSGAYLAGGVSAALFQRERTGKATVVDVSLLGAAVWTLSVDLVPTSILGVDPAPHAPGRSLASVLVGSYRTRDGRWLSLNMLDPERHWAPTCRALGLEHLLDRDDLATAAQRAEHNTELFPLFTETIASHDLTDLKARLSAEDTIWSTMASPVEVLEDPQVEANGYMPRHPGHERARLTSSPVQFDGRGLEIRRRAPGIGEHTDEVLHEAGFGDAEIDALRRAGAVA
jgi:crotonobetainyl-CoA:carnitine CoA-transferase CaiB-like acyl-CoA transferase